MGSWVGSPCVKVNDSPKISEKAKKYQNRPPNSAPGISANADQAVQLRTILLTESLEGG
jgi:hypothetical protein